jgi:hypothetical protein
MGREFRGLAPTITDEPAFRAFGGRRMGREFRGLAPTTTDMPAFRAFGGRVCVDC